MEGSVSRKHVKCKVLRSWLVSYVIPMPGAFAKDLIHFDAGRPGANAEHEDSGEHAK